MGVLWETVCFTRKRLGTTELMIRKKRCKTKRDVAIINSGSSNALALLWLPTLVTQTLILEYIAGRISTRRVLHSLIQNDDDGNPPYILIRKIKRKHLNWENYRRMNVSETIKEVGGAASLIWCGMYLINQFSCACWVAKCCPEAIT